MIRCVMADDHVLVREILCKIMEQTSTIRIIGDHGDACEAAMKLKIEQLDSSVKGRVIRKTYKRRNAKLNRRLAKADPENAPTKPRYRGYVS